MPAAQTTAPRRQLRYSVLPSAAVRSSAFLRSRTKAGRCSLYPVRPQHLRHPLLAHANQPRYLRSVVLRR